MTDMPKMGHRELVIAAAGPVRLGETHMRVFERLGKRSGYKPETLAKFWKGQNDSKRVAARLAAIAEQNRTLAATLAQSDPELALSYSYLAGALAALAGRRG